MTGVGGTTMAQKRKSPFENPCPFAVTPGLGSKHEEEGVVVVSKDER
jgi:hypothetical protein